MTCTTTSAATRSASTIIYDMTSTNMGHVHDNICATKAVTSPAAKITYTMTFIATRFTVTMTCVKFFAVKRSVTGSV
jgi:hypothetical protein